MNDPISMLPAVDFWTQLRSEYVHLIAVALQYGALGLVGIFWFYYRRYVKHGDEDVAKNKATITEHHERLASHDRQIRDLRGAVGCCEIAAKIEHYKFSD